MGEATVKTWCENPGVSPGAATHPGRVWAEVDLDAVAHNFRMVRARVGSAVRILAVVKADAYGHGAVPVARRLEAEGAFGFGVGDASEALELREAGVRKPILILGAVVPSEVPDAVRHDVSVSLFSSSMARLLHREALARGRKAKVHLKADTGMGRLGLPPAKILELAEYARSLEGLHVEGIFTHCPESRSECVAGQLHSFSDLLESMNRMGVRPRLAHMASSGVLFRYRSAHFDLVRPGISLYGVDPGELGSSEIGLVPALSVRTQIVFLKRIPVGGFVGYRPGYRAWRTTRIATLPVGYADGYSTLLSHRGCVLVRGREAPLAGRVSMDYATIDVGHVPGVRQGDRVTLLGRDGGMEISAGLLADMSGTIPYEILTLLSSRRVVKTYLGRTCPDGGSVSESMLEVRRRSPPRPPTDSRNPAPLKTGRRRIS